MVIPYKGILHDSIGYQHLQLPMGNGRRGACSDFEMNAMECLEAYGIIKGVYTCQKYLEDFQECKVDAIKEARVYAMKYERFMKVAKGELPPKLNYVDPIPYDSYIAATFWP